MPVKTEAVLGTTKIIRLLNSQYRLELFNGGGADTYKLTVLGSSTVAIVESMTAALVQTSLEALPLLVNGDVSVTGVAGGPYVIEFIGNYLGVNLEMTVGSETGTIETLLFREERELSILDSIVNAGMNQPQNVSIGASENYAYVGSKIGSTLAVVDISDLNNIAYLGGVGDVVALTEPLYNVVNAAETKVFVTNIGNQGIAVVDVTTKNAPAVLGSIIVHADLNGCRQCALGGSENYLYVANTTSKMTIVDVSNPAAPVVVGSVSTGGAAYGVAVLGDESYAFAAASTSGVRAINVSNPAAPVEVDFLSASLSGGFCKLSKDEQTLFVVNATDSQLLLIDVSDPINMALIATLDLIDAALYGNVELSPDGKHVFLSSEANNTIYMVNVENPVSPKVESIFIDAVQLNDSRALWVGSGFVIALSKTSDYINSISFTELAGTETTIGSQLDSTTTISNGKDEITNKQSPPLLGGGVAKEHILTDQEKTIDMSNIFTPSPHDDAQQAAQNAADNLLIVQLVIYDSDGETREVWEHALIQNLGDSAPNSAARRQSFAFMRSGASIFTG